MNRHTAWDTLFIQKTIRDLGRGVFFSESLESPHIGEMIGNCTVSTPEIKGEGDYEVTAETPVGELRPAFMIPKWCGTDYPTLIWHHGSNEQPFDFSPKAANAFNYIIGPPTNYPELNIIIIRAAYHAGSAETYVKAVGHLKKLVAMLAVSVLLGEQLCAHMKRISEKMLVLSGISLGGYVANLHRCYFNSADAYVPLLAGAALDDLFLGTKYKRLTAKEALDKPAAIVRVLNFEDDFISREDNNVFPLLAEFDRFARLEVQRRCYGEHPLVVIDKGHVTAAHSGEVLRDHVLDVFQDPSLKEMKVE